jgi:hypothetical protein
MTKRTQRERFERNAVANGVELIINTKNCISWVALNKAFQMFVYFDDEGNWIKNERVWF